MFLGRFMQMYKNQFSMSLLNMNNGVKKKKNLKS